MKKIIIADDSALARMFTKRCIDVAGITDVEYIEAENGKEALDRMKEILPDLLISDLNMPEMNGVELVRRVNASPKLSGTPIIIITSAGNSEQREELMSLGVKTILTKPITPPDIVDAISGLLDEGDLFYG
jgi:two-component system chemotaxis response regulator CheY